MKPTVKQLNMILEDRERDIELAARIGQTLLAKNRQLQTRLDQVDLNLNELRTLNDRFTEENHQLKHQIILKDDLLRGFEDEQNRSQETCQNHIQDLEDRSEKLEGENAALRRQNEEMAKNFSMYKWDMDTETESDLHRLRGDVTKFKTEVNDRNQIIRSLEDENSQQFGRILELERSGRKRELELIEKGKNAEASQMSLAILKDEIEVMEQRLLQFKNETDELKLQLKISKEDREIRDELNLALEIAQQATPQNAKKILSSTRCDGDGDSGLVDEECFYSEILSEISTPTRISESIQEEEDQISQLPQPNIVTPKPQLSAKAR